MQTNYIAKEEVTGALSISQIKTFLMCRKQWEYVYKMNLSPRIDHASLTIGKLAHEAMAGAWKAKIANGEIDLNGMANAGVAALNVAYQKFIDKFPTMEGDDSLNKAFDSQRDTAVEIFRRAIEGFHPENWEPIVIPGELLEDPQTPMIEVHFLIPCIGERKLQGFIDLVAREKSTDTIWQIDYKFQSSLGDPADEMFNMQNTVYQYACEKMKIPVCGSLTYQVLNKPSTLPSINKNGAISRAKVRCDWLTYAQFCLDNGQDPSDYELEMKEKLSDNEWTREIREYRNLPTLKQAWKTVIVGTAYEVIRKQKRYPRNISHITCRGCAFREPCHGELRGYDVDGMLKTDFVKRGKIVESVIEEEDTQDGV